MVTAEDDRATVVVAGGSYVERLVSHPRLPLVAGLNSARPTVQVWELGPAGLREVGAVGSDAEEYPAEPWERDELVPCVAWHPHEPRLVVTGGPGLRQWTPDGTSPLSGAPTDAAYDSVAFSPDGSTVWASPSSSDDGAGQSSDAFDPVSGELRLGPWWDTAVVEHPSGGLVVTLSSDQGATDLLFARPGDDVPARMHVLRRAIILDVDFYEAPIFSPDGRYLAVRGNAYVQSLDVFEFPSLRKVLHTELGDPYPGYPYPPEWLEEQATWSHHNIAFTRSGALLIGTPRGSLVEVDLVGEHAVEHHLLDAQVGALAVLPTGQLVLADRTGQVTAMAAPGAAVRHDSVAGEASARERVAAFLAATSELPGDADLDTDLVRTDGVRSWDSDDLDSVTEADESDPTWLRLQAAINAFRGTWVQ